MIYTLTLNTAIDYRIKIKNFSLGKDIKAKEVAKFQSGKGINVAVAIECLKKNVKAFGFIGKDDKKFFDEMNSNYLDLDLIAVNGETRRNFTLIDEKKLIAHIRSIGYELNKKETEKIFQKLDSSLKSDDILIISGSIPPGASEMFYKEIISKYKKIKIILDSSGPSLKNALMSKPFLIKPNIEELNELFKNKLKPTIKEYIKVAKSLNDKGVEYVLISLGKNGVILTKKNIDGYYSAKIKFEKSYSSREEIGCGDAMVGGIGVALSENMEIKEMLKLAVACGSANLFTIGPGRFDYKTMDQLKKEVDVKHNPF